MGRHSNNNNPPIRKHKWAAPPLKVVRQLCWVCGTWAHSLPDAEKPTKCSMCGTKFEKPKWWDLP